MKQYPSISRDPVYDRDVLLFEKIDGSNIRAEWSKKEGFYKFGTRKAMLGPDSLFAEARELITVREPTIREIMTKNSWDRAVLFFEFWGPGSFAGNHEPEPHRATLIDVDVYRRGQIDPRQFVESFVQVEHLDVCRFLGRGFNKETERLVRAGQLEGQTFEGIVGKKPSHRQWTPPQMFKVKSDAWIAKVKERYADLASELL